MDNIDFLKKYSKQTLPIRQKRQLEDLLVYKKNIILLRNNFNNNVCSKIRYIKKTTNQVKQYEIQLHTYYFSRQKKETIIVAKDINSRNNFDKTFILQNVINVEKTNKKVNQKNIKIN